jgi:hypothetical protein
VEYAQFIHKPKGSAKFNIKKMIDEVITEQTYLTEEVQISTFYIGFPLKNKQQAQKFLGNNITKEDQILMIKSD